VQPTLGTTDLADGIHRQEGGFSWKSRTEEGKCLMFELLAAHHIPEYIFIKLCKL
jgi:hypothetical protein